MFVLLNFILKDIFESYPVGFHYDPFSIFTATIAGTKRSER